MSDELRHLVDTAEVYLAACRLVNETGIPDGPGPDVADWQAWDEAYQEFRTAVGVSFCTVDLEEAARLVVRFKLTLDENRQLRQENARLIVGQVEVRR